MSRQHASTQHASRPVTTLLAALAVATVLGGTASAQVPAQGDLATPTGPKHGGPHRDPPGALAVFVRCPPGWQRVPQGVNPALRCLPTHLLATMGKPARTPAGPVPGCPAGWRPVAPELNPVLRCQPVNLAARPRPGAQSPTQPIGCPDGWRRVGRDVNPLLRCLPDSIAAAPPKSAPPPGCPQGWKPVAPGVNPLMRCLPDRMAASGRARPQRTGPDPGEPAQAGATTRPKPR